MPTPQHKRLKPDTYPYPRYITSLPVSSTLFPSTGPKVFCSLPPAAILCTNHYLGMHRHLCFACAFSPPSHNCPSLPRWCSDHSQLPMHTCHPPHLPRLSSPTPPLNHNDNSNMQMLTTSTCGIAQEILEGDFTSVSGKLIYYIYSFQLT